MHKQDLLSLSGISKRYGKSIIVDDFALQIHQGEFVTILGESGAGKSTVLKIIAGMLEPDNGTISFLGQDITNQPSHKRPFAMVFQSYALFPHMTVKENLAFPLKRMKRYTERAIIEKVNQLSESLGLDGLQNRKPNQLSGGQQQRVGLGRALLKVLNAEVGVDKALLLMDEPLSSLDKNLRQSMQVEIKKLQKQFGLTICYVTHDQTEALSMSDRVALIKKGVIVQIDKPFVLYERPINRYVAGFFGLTNIISGQLNHPNGDSIILQDGTKLHLPQTKSLLESAAEILVHPEKISFTPINNSQVNKLQVEIIDCVYQGSLVHFRTRTNTGIEIFVQSLNFSAQALPRVGDTTMLYWNVNDTWILGN